VITFVITLLFFVEAGEQKLYSYGTTLVAAFIICKGQNKHNFILNVIGLPVACQQIDAEVATQILYSRNKIQLYKIATTTISAITKSTYMSFN
jgi:hypothetical protein